MMSRLTPVEAVLPLFEDKGPVTLAQRVAAAMPDEVKERFRAMVRRDCEAIRKVLRAALLEHLRAIRVEQNYQGTWTST